MYRILIAIILMLPTFSHAINYLGFGGGNYVYAEQGNLYFNLDPYVFDNRAWTYDETTGFSTEIKVNMDLKTKYTSDEWIEQVFANKKSDGLMYANYIKQPFNYQNRGNYQQTWFWLARMAPTVGGFIGRTAAWGTFKKAVVGGLAGSVAGAFFCAEVMNDAITCGKGELFEKTVTYAYELNEYGSHGIGTFTVRATPKQFETDNGLANAVFPHVARTHANFGGTLKECVSKANNPVVSCNYPKPNGQADWFDTNAFVGLAQPVTITEIVSDPELQWYFDRTCKLFASECVNEPTQGKNVKDVQLTGGVVGSPVNVTGPPYTHPITGQSQQDHVAIGGSSSGIGVNSGTNSAWEYTPSLGQSTMSNAVDVSTTARPDLTNTGTAPVAKPNEQTGTKPQVVVPPVTVPEFTDLNDMIDFCKANPKATSCVETGTGEEAESIFDKIKIPEINLPTEFSKDNFLPATAACPAPSSIVTSHGTIMYSYDKHCEIAAFLRPIILIMATITGLFIIVRSKD